MRWLTDWWAWTKLTLGNEQGFSGGDSKEAARQEGIAQAREGAQATLNSLLAQLVPGSEEYNRLVAEGGRLVQNVAGPEDEEQLIRQLGTQLVSAQQARITGGGPATALEARTQQAFEQLRGTAGFTPEEQAIFSALRGTPIEGTEGAGVNDIFSQLVGRAQNPDQYYQSTFNPQLQLLQDAVRSRAASRGILGSGLELENLGRAGVELAISEAQNREAFRQSQLSNFMNLFNVSQQLRGREIGLEEALLNLQSGRESRLTDLLGQQTFQRGSDLRDLFMRQSDRSQTLFDRAEEANARRAEQIGQLFGAAAGFAIGGPSGAAVGSQIGGGVGGRGNASELLSSQRSPTAQGGVPQLQGQLSRTPRPIEQLTPEQLAALMRQANA